MLREKEIIEQLQGGRIPLPPLSMRLLQLSPELGKDCRLDALVEISWRGKMVTRFAAEIRSLSTPKAFQNALNLLKMSSLPNGIMPMLIMPYLNEQQLQELERQNISGIDLCGNYVVIAPGKFGVFRTGEKNRFPSSALIKNIYRKNSSMVGRVFLARSSFETVQDVCSEINGRNLLVERGMNKPMSLSTVSKSLKTLEDDLIIERKGSIRLIQADKLLEKLSANYAPRKTRRLVRLKVTEKDTTTQELLLTESRVLGLPIVATGLSSVMQYAVMQRGDILSIYCPQMEALLERMPGSQTDRFPNLELIETDDETVFFDTRQERNFLWASPVQVYLELMAGDKRDRETAEQVKSLILKNSQ